MLAGRSMSSVLRRSLPSLMLAAILAAFMPPAGWAAEDPARGKREFLRCVICHSAEPSIHKSGPSLATVYGRAAGTVEGFARYSDALKQADIAWTDERLDAWLRDPQAVIPGNAMVMQGIRDARVRQDLVAYLKELAAWNR